MEEEIIQIIILGPTVILSLIAGIFLIIRGREKSDKGMVILGISYILMICFFVFWGFDLAPLYITYTIMFVVYMGMNFFTKSTFHIDQNRNFIWIMVATTINYLIQVIPAFLEHYNFNDFINSYIGSLKSYNQIKFKKVQPWIKKRLLLVIIAAFINMFVSVPNLIDDITNRIHHDYVFYIQIIMIATIMVMQYLAWIMPKGLKKFFNRGYSIEKEIETELSEEEIIKQMSGGDENK